MGRPSRGPQMGRPGRGEAVRRRVRARRAASASLALAAVAVLALVAIPAALAAFGARTENSEDLVKAAPDFVAPSVSAVALGKTQGGASGFVKTGGTYYVYANVEADKGNPASGIATVKANVAVYTSGATEVALTAGTYTAGGLSYNYRSEALTDGLAEGSMPFTVQATDKAGNAATKPGTATIDNAPPNASDVQTTNVGGGTAGLPEAGDKLILTYSEPIEPESILAGWTGTAATPVTVHVNDNGLLGLPTGNDSVNVFDSKNEKELPLGVVDLGRNDYAAGLLGGYYRFNASSMAINGNSVEITLGTYEATIIVGPFRGTTAAAGTMVWAPTNTTPVTAPYDRAANVVSTAKATESGAADKDF